MRYFCFHEHFALGTPEVPVAGPSDHWAEGRDISGQALISRGFRQGGGGIAYYQSMSVAVPRINLSVSDASDEVALHFIRRQFPVRLAYCMTMSNLFFPFPNYISSLFLFGSGGRAIAISNS